MTTNNKNENVFIMHNFKWLIIKFFINKFQFLKSAIHRKTVSIVLDYVSKPLDYVSFAEIRRKKEKLLNIFCCNFYYSG